MNKKQFFLVLSFLVFFFLVRFLFIPGLNRCRSFNKKIDEKEKEITELRKLKEEETEKRVGLNRLNLNKKVSLLSALENLLIKEGLKGRVASLKKDETTLGEIYRREEVEIELNRMNLKEIVQFLIRIEEEPNLFTESLFIEKKKDGSLSTKIKIDTYYGENTISD